MKNWYYIFLIPIVVMTLGFYLRTDVDDFNELSVNDLLETISDTVSVNHLNESIEGYSAEIGEDIVKNGFSKRDGAKKSKRQSKHFVCTSCHNTEREDPDLSNPNPDDRLVYTAAKGMPFLQATTLYGAVNRSSFYNGDYEKKYGDLVVPARNDIREAIQLCAVECAQGRKLKDWEVESILAYMWDIDLKVNDLRLSDMEHKLFKEAYDQKEVNENLSNGLLNSFSQGGEIHFVLPPVDRKLGYELDGDPARGEMIYENSCLHCHYQKEYSYFNLDRNKMTYNYMARKADDFSRHSIYQVIRYGTFSMYGKKSYMPKFPAEKMSDQQVEDLRAYLEMKASE